MELENFYTENRQMRDEIRYKDEAAMKLEAGQQTLLDRQQELENRLTEKELAIQQLQGSLSESQTRVSLLSERTSLLEAENGTFRQALEETEEKNLRLVHSLEREIGSKAREFRSRAQQVLNQSPGFYTQQVVLPYRRGNKKNQGQEGERGQEGISQNFGEMPETPPPVKDQSLGVSQNQARPSTSPRANSHSNTSQQWRPDQGSSSSSYYIAGKYNQIQASASKLRHILAEKRQDLQSSMTPQMLVNSVRSEDRFLSASSGGAHDPNVGGYTVAPRSVTSGHSPIQGHGYRVDMSPSHSVGGGPPVEKYSLADIKARLALLQSNKQRLEGKIMDFDRKVYAAHR